MKIVFLEKETLGEDIDFSHFNDLGSVELYSRAPSIEENAARIGDADIIVTNKLPVGKELLDNAPNVKLIAASATGTNNIDFEYTNNRGIKVANAKNYSTASVVQHTFAMFFYLYEKLAVYDRFVKSGDYGRYHMFSCFTPYFNELAGKTWGIIGLGAIGRGVADIAKAFGCNVIYYSTSGKNSNKDYEQVSLEELMSRSDVVSLHCPLTPATNELINKDRIKLMKKEAILLNLARGPVINENDLLYALNNDLIAGAGLDVLHTEPMSESCPLIKVNNPDKLLITPHMAWGTREARKRCLDEVYKNIQAFISSI